MSKQGIKNVADMSAEEFCEHSIKNGPVPEELREPALTILTWIESGPEAAKKVSEKAVSNLYNAGLAEDGKLVVPREGPNELWFLVALVAADKGSVTK